MAAANVPVARGINVSNRSARTRAFSTDSDTGELEENLPEENLKGIGL